MFEADYRDRSPSLRIPTDRPGEVPEEGIALCLSGGGYRAMLFHTGALLRLNQAGLLPKLKRVSSVSGGSITAARLAMVWSRLNFNQNGVAEKLEKELVEPLCRLAGKTIDIQAGIAGLFGAGLASRVIAGSYRKYLFGRSTLQALPDEKLGPRFIFNATNLQSGVLWRFSKTYAADYRVGRILDPKIELAVAVAASSAFPPFLSPAILRFNEGDFKHASGLDLHYPPFTTRVVLSDGGVYDNLGIETAWKNYTTILVSDGGGKMHETGQPAGFWPLQMYRVLNVIDSQVRSRRKIQVIQSFRAPPGQTDHRDGAYWSNWTDIADYCLPDALDCPVSSTRKLAEIPTRLARLDHNTQLKLINWGYAVSDAAIRRYYDPTLPAPGGFPYPEAGIG